VVNNLRATSQAATDGTVRIADNGAAAGTSKIDTLSIDPGAKVDLRNNHLVITTTPIGIWNGSNYTGVQGMIQSGRNGGSWDGSGLLSSNTIGSFTSLGVATAAQVKGIAAGATAVWSGQTVTGSDTLVMYTYGGDANLDGKINVDDYGQIDFNVAARHAAGSTATSTTTARSTSTTTASSTSTSASRARRFRRQAV
jgi:hypothetical protein